MTLYREKMFEKINHDLIVMSKVVFKQIKFISEKLSLEDAQIYSDDIVQNESMIDGLEIKIRKNVIATVLFYSPRASDLRKIMSCYDITISLERIADLLQNIDKALSDVDFKGELYQSIKEDLRELLVLTEAMAKDSIYSFVQEDMELSRMTIKCDDNVDAKFRLISEKIIAVSTGKNLGEQQLKELISLNALAHNFERIADYATNIVEAAVYLIEGKNIQHTKLVEKKK
ncbi:MAG: PhoU domain-containing protein [Rikenellaceae bacterium]